MCFVRSVRAIEIMLALLVTLLVACDGGMAMDFDRALHAHPGWPRRHLALRGGAGRDAGCGEGLTWTGRGDGGSGGEDGGVEFDFDHVSAPLSPACACGVWPVRVHTRSAWAAS